MVGRKVYRHMDGQTSELPGAWSCSQCSDTSLHPPPHHLCSWCRAAWACLGIPWCVQPAASPAAARGAAPHSCRCFGPRCRKLQRSWEQGWAELRVLAQTAASGCGAGRALLSAGRHAQLTPCQIWLLPLP